MQNWRKFTEINPPQTTQIDKDHKMTNPPNEEEQVKDHLIDAAVSQIQNGDDDFVDADLTRPLIWKGLRMHDPDGVKAFEALTAILGGMNPEARTRTLRAVMGYFHEELSRSE